MKKTKSHYLLAFFLLTGVFCMDVQGQSNYPAKLMMPYRSGQLWGYCDTLGKVLLQPQYDSTGFFEFWGEKAAIIKKAGKYGLIDDKLSIVVPAQHETLLSLLIKNKKYLLLSLNGKHGVVTIEGDTIVPFQYDNLDISCFYQTGALLTLQNGKWGIISLVNSLSVKPEYDSIELTQFYHEIQGGFVGKKGDQLFHIKNNGEVTPVKNLTSYAESVPNRKDLDKLNPEQRLPKETRERLRRIEPVLKDTAKITKILYDRPLGYGWGEYSYILVQKDKKVAALDLTSTKITTKYYEEIVDIMNFMAPVSAPPTFDVTDNAPVQELPYNLLYLVKKNGKYGVLNESEKQVFPFIYDGFGEISNNYIITKQKKKQGAILLFTIYPPIPCKYDSISYEGSTRVNKTWSFGVYRVTLDGKMGYVGENGVEYFK